jgi:hypothetical protein
MDATAPWRAEVALVSADDRTTSSDCIWLTSADRADEFVEMFKLRATVAELSPVESDVSAFCSKEPVVEIAELSD